MVYIYEDIYKKNNSIERNRIISKALNDYTHFMVKSVKSFNTKIDTKPLTEDLPIFWKFLSEHQDGEYHYYFDDLHCFYDLDKASVYITNNYEVIKISVEEK